MFDDLMVYVYLYLDVYSKDAGDGAHITGLAF